MIDRHTEEQAISYVLDELSSRERARFARQVSTNPKLRAHVRSLEDTLSGYAVLSTKQRKAPLAVLAAAKAQTRIIETPRRRQNWLRRASAIAAIAMVSAAVGFLTGRGPIVPAREVEHAASGIENNRILRTGSMSEAEQAAELKEVMETLRQRVLFLEHQSQQAVQKETVLREALHELLRRSPGSLRSEEFLARLEDALELPPGSLDATIAALLQSLARTSDGPGIAQVTVMELTPPGGAREPSLAPVASSIISEAFWKVVQDSQGLVAAYDESAGDQPLNRSDDGIVSPASLNRGREGVFAPPTPGVNLQPGTSTDQGEATPNAGGALEAPVGPNIPALTEQVVSDIEQVVQPSSPVGFAVWDQGSRSGSLSLRDVPTLEQGQAYQLWGEDAVSGDPFSIGLLPSMNGGTGRVFFDLSDGDPSPSRLFVTTEPEGGSSLPRGQIIIESPTGVSPEPIE